MCWQCDHPEATREDYLDLMRGMIRSHGWAVQGVAGNRLYPQWFYTVGLTEHGLPELVVTGIPQRLVGVRLNGPAQGALEEGPPQPGSQRSFADGVLWECVPLTDPTAHLHIAVEIFGPGIRALQLVWQDDRGRWPWDVGFRSGRGGQPVLGPLVRDERGRGRAAV
jgi:hypothetical protein